MCAAALCSRRHRPFSGNAADPELFALPRRQVQTGVITVASDAPHAQTCSTMLARDVLRVALFEAPSA